MFNIICVYNTAINNTLLLPISDLKDTFESPNIDEPRFGFLNCNKV